jgi:hypothetical protein
MLDRAPDLPRAALVARTEIVRGYRAIRESRTQVASLAFAAIFLGTFVAGTAVFGGYAVGRELRSGTLDWSLLSTGRGVVALLWLGVFVFVALRSMGKYGDVDAGDGLLTTLPVRDVVAGFVLAEAARFALVLTLPVGLVLGAFAFGASAPAVAVTGPVVGVLVLATAVPAGYATGIALREAFLGYEPLARYRTPVAVIAFVLYMSVFLTGNADSVVQLLYDPAKRTPLGWFADLLALGVPGLSSSPIRAVGAVALVGAIAPTGLAVGVWAANRHWLADRSADDAAEERRYDGESRFGRVLANVTSRPTRAVALTVWRRARRAPVRLVYVLYPLFGAASIVQDVIQKGFVPGYVPPLMLVYVAWATGAAFTLNPLGDQGPTLQGTLTTGVSGRTFLRGHLLVGTIVGTPAVVLVVGGLGVLSPLALPTVAVLVAAGVAVTAAGSALATGFGVVYPRFGTVSVVGNRQATAPSKLAAITYSLGILFTAGLAVPAFVPGVTDALATLLANSLDVTSAGIVARAIGLAGLATAFGLAWGSYRYAARQVDAFYLDD